MSVPAEATSLSSPASSRADVVAFLKRAEADLAGTFREYESEAVALRSLPAASQVNASLPPSTMPATRAALLRASDLVGEGRLNLAVGFAMGSHLLGKAILTPSAPPELAPAAAWPDALSLVEMWQSSSSGELASGLVAMEWRARFMSNCLSPIGRLDLSTISYATLDLYHSFVATGKVPMGGKRWMRAYFSSFAVPKLTIPHSRR